MEWTGEYWIRVEFLVQIGNGLKVFLLSLHLTQTDPPPAAHIGAHASASRVRRLTFTVSSVASSTSNLHSCHFQAREVQHAWPAGEAITSCKGGRCSVFLSYCSVLLTRSVTGLAHMLCWIISRLNLVRSFLCLILFCCFVVVCLFCVACHFPPLFLCVSFFYLRYLICLAYDCMLIVFGFTVDCFYHSVALFFFLLLLLYFVVWALNFEHNSLAFRTQNSRLIKIQLHSLPLICVLVASMEYATAQRAIGTASGQQQATFPGGSLGPGLP